MKKVPVLAILIVLLALPSPGAAQPPIARSCVVGPLSGVYQAVRCPEVWDLTACDLTVDYTLDLRGMTPPAMGSTSWTSVGLRRCSQSGTQCSGGGWLSASGPLSFLDDENDYDWDPTHPGPDPAFDLDDKLVLQTAPAEAELSYDVLDPDRIQPPFGTYDRYGIWFDRDGVNPWQSASWGAIDGGTYNTDGVYAVSIALDAAGHPRITTYDPG